MFKHAKRFQPDAATASVNTSLTDVFTLFLYHCNQSRLLVPLLPALKQGMMARHSSEQIAENEGLTNARPLTGHRC